MSSAILTATACEQALACIQPSLEAHLAASGLFGVPDGELVVLDPTVRVADCKGPHDPSFQSDVILWRHQFGDVDNWPFDFGTFARAKAYLSFKHGLPADVVIAHYPYVLEPGFAKYGGSAVDPIGGQVVAFSGAAPHQDKFINESMIAAARMVCDERMRAALADPGLHILAVPAN